MKHYQSHYLTQLKLGLIILAIAGVVFFFTGLFGCGEPYLPKHDIVENQKYDAPAKSQILLRIVLKDSVTKQNVERLLQKHFEWSMQTDMKHHNPPSHIFIYVYNDSTDWKRNGLAWVGMQKRVAGVNEAAQFSETIE